MAFQMTIRPSEADYTAAQAQPPAVTRSVAPADPWAEFQDAPQASAGQGGAPADPWAEFKDAPTKDAPKLADPGVVASGLEGVLNGVSFGFAPRIKAGVRSALGMGDYADELANANQDMAAAEQNHPIITGVGNVVGAIASPVSKLGMVVKGATLAGKVVNGIGQGAVAGGLFGASQSTDLADIGQTAGDAARGAALGGFTGGIIAPAAAGIGKVAGSIVNRVGDQAAGKALNVPTAAAAKVGEAVAQDAATGSLRAPGEGDMLMNLGPQLTDRARGIATQPGEGSNILLDASKQQQMTEGGRIKAVVDRTLGADQGRVLDAAAVKAEAQAAGSQIKAAKQFPGTFDMGQTVSDLDAKIAAADGPVASTLQKARDLKVFDGKPKTAEQLHQARMALDDMLEKAGSDPATSAGRNAKAALGEVRSAIDTGLKTVPGMKQADAAFSSAMKSKQALMDGRDVFTKAYGSPEELKAELAAMDPAVRDRFVKGARDAITALMGSARNDAAAVRRELFDKGWNKEKLQVLVGPQTAGIIDRTLAGSVNRAEGRAKIASGSDTANKLASQKAFPGPVDSAGAADKLAGKPITGVALSMLVGLANKVSGGMVTGAINKSRAATATGAARLLSSQGATRDQVLQVLQAAQQRTGRALNVKEQMAAITQAFATRAAVPAVVGASRSEARP